MIPLLGYLYTWVGHKAMPLTIGILYLRHKTNQTVKVYPWSGGKMLGGSSGLSYLAWNRASKPEYDAWEDLGNPGWNWKGLLPNFLKSENVTVPEANKDSLPGSNSTICRSAYHGSGGPLQICYNTFHSNITPNFVETVNSLGVKTKADPVSHSALPASTTEISRGDRRQVYWQEIVCRPHIL